MFALRVPCDHPPTHYCLSWDDASSAPSLLSVLSATAAPSQHKNNKLQPYKPQFKSSPVHWTESYCRRHLQLYRLYNGPTRWTQSQYSSWIANSKFTQSARISQQNHWWCEMSHFLYDSVSTHCPVGTNPLRFKKGCWTLFSQHAIIAMVMTTDPDTEIHIVIQLWVVFPLVEFSYVDALCRCRLLKHTALLLNNILQLTHSINEQITSN